MSVSHSALDSGFENNNIIKAEVIANCENTEKWADHHQVATFVPSTETKNPNKNPYSILTFFHKTNPDLEPALAVAKYINTALAVLQNTSCILKSNSFSSQLVVSSSQSTTSFQSLTLNKDVSSHSKTSKDSVLSKSFFTKSSSIRKVPNFYNNNNIECPSNIILPPKEVLNALQSFEQNDVAFFRQKVKFLSDHEIFLLTKNMFIPNEIYIFPKNSGHQFRYLWLKEFWLRYSKSTDGAFCLSCVLFGNKFKLRLTHLYLEPFNKWSDAIRSFSNHESTKNGLHAFTMPVFNIFLSHSSGISQPINVIIDTNVKEKIIKNRQILCPIVDAIIFCGQTNTPLRGHRDDSQYLPEAGEYSKCGTGCFNKLLNFAVRNENDVLGSHLNNCSKNASYISKTSQNEIIKCCDEACDSSTKEQMSLVLQFVDSDFNIRKDFIQFIHCSEGVKGKDLFNVLLNCVSNLNLDIKNCRGQGYDGASSVTGYINGLSAQVLNINSKALYTHCHSHRLNLSICESCNVQLVSEVFNKVRKLSYFFNYSENRQKFLEASILEREPQMHKKKLKDICRTRWIERIDGLNTFLEHYLSIFHALCIMASPESSVNKDTQNKSSTFLNSIGTFQFVFTLVVTTRVFDFTLPVTRNDIDSFHNNCYEAACLFSSKAEIFVLKSRTCSIQKNRSNVPSESVSEYFKRAVTIPLIDHVSTSISTRFKSETVAAYKGLSIIPFNFISFLKRLKTQLCWRKQFEIFCDFYINDFPNISALNGELVLWEKYWESFSGTIPDNISLTLKSVSFPGFENIKIALRILATLPVTSCECERSFSVMRRLKNYMRTTMSEDRLNGLALMYIYQEIVPCINNVINRFSIKNRQLDFND
ncbi:52 kDa repressor of the inhibitor of the protein kinase-like [Hydra vulgaris]|uniref:52 kDa repressor of the inhibitor of the protein kinase-like n=1 Tax=Hydra vulgaris TaxID=6087 RepID=UPI0032EA7718